MLMGLPSPAGHRRHPRLYWAAGGCQHPLPPMLWRAAAAAREDRGLACSAALTLADAAWRQRRPMRSAQIGPHGPHRPHDPRLSSMRGSMCIHSARADMIIMVSLTWGNHNGLPHLGLRIHRVQSVTQARADGGSRHLRLGNGWESEVGGGHTTARYGPSTAPAPVSA